MAEGGGGLGDFGPATAVMLTGRASEWRLKCLFIWVQVTFFNICLTYQVKKCSGSDKKIYLICCCSMVVLCLYNLIAMATYLLFAFIAIMLAIINDQCYYYKYVCLYYLLVSLK